MAEIRFDEDMGDELFDIKFIVKSLESLSAK